MRSVPRSNGFKLQNSRKLIENSSPFGRWQRIRELLRLKFKYAMASSVATLVDYSLYLFLFYTILPPVPSNIISYSCSVLVNFTLQRRYIFSLQRKASSVFLLAMLVSAGGLAISSGLIYGLNKIPFFHHYQFITKMVASGLVFFYNFYFKRYAFERRFF